MLYSILEHTRSSELIRIYYSFCQTYSKCCRITNHYPLYTCRNFLHLIINQTVKMKCLYIYEWAISRFSIIWFNDNPYTLFCKIKKNKVVYGFWSHFPRFLGNSQEVEQKSRNIKHIKWVDWFDSQSDVILRTVKLNSKAKLSKAQLC